MSNQVHLSDSLIRIQKAKICSSLLNRIRLIQGSTNLNFNQPHFIESKDNFGQTKDIIQSIKEDLKKGCSELIRTCEQRASSFRSDTNSSLSGKGKKLNKKRVDQKTNSDKIAGKELLKQLKSKNFCEGGESLSFIKLSQIFSNGPNQQGLPLASSVSTNNAKSVTNKRKKRKRKQGAAESNSSLTLTLSQSKCDIVKDSHGDIGSNKTKPRKIRVRSSRKRVCSGDESDVEDCSSSTATVQVDTNQKQIKSRRKLRPKHPNKAMLVKSEQGDVPDINRMVSSTIERLNNVKESVQKVIEESLSSSGSSQRTSMASVHTMTSAFQNSNTVDASVSSLNWSTVTMTNNLSQMSMMTQKPSQTGRVPVKKIITKLSNTRTMKHPIPQHIQVITPPSTAISMSSTSEQISTNLDDIAMKLVKKKIKQNQHQQQQGDNHKIKEEIEKALVAEKEISAKKKRSTKVKDSLPDARKAVNKKKKSKKRDHVNFNDIPEVVPDKVFIPTPVPLLEWKPCLKSTKNRVKEATPSHETRASTTTATREENASSVVNKTKPTSTRRVNSAKIYRNIHQKSPAKVKSAGNLNEENNQPITVRSVLENEAKNLKELQEQRKSRSRSRSGSTSRAASTSGKKDSSRTRHIMEIYQKVRSNTNSCIANINEQMSCTLKEGIAHLNDICGKVRTTLTDMEKDEETYQKLKSKKSFDVSSEGGSVHDVLTAQTSKMDTGPSTPERVKTPIEKTAPVPHTYTILTESRPDMGQLIHSISMGDNDMAEETEPKSISTRRKRRKSGKDKRPCNSSKPNRVPSAATLKPKVAPTSSSATIKATPVRVPIWQRTPPSIIEEIQLTVKKQATKSQYKEFLRALKNIARKQRSQVHIMPRDYRETMEKQHDKVFGGDSIKQTQTQALNRKRKEDAPSKKPCQNCNTDGCNCGVVVETPLSAPSQHRMHWMHIRTDSKKGIQAYDILDEITLKDLEPIQSEYPRKDHICDTDANKRIEKTLLYKLLYHEDPKILESLLRSTPSTLEHNKAIARLSVAPSNEKPKSASNAYKLYEQLEFNVDRPQINHLNATKAAMCITMPDIAKSKLKEQSRPIHSCSREFNDEVNIPFDLKPKPSKRKLFAKVIRSDNNRTTSLCQKRIEDKLKIIGKKSSIKSISKRIKGGKYSRENIKARLRNYVGDSKLKMKKILTVMPVTVVTGEERLKKCKINKVQIFSNAVKDQQNITNQSDLQISEENKDKIMKMSKREIVQILKPYIFHELQPPTIIAMPVVPKYNYQTKQQKQDYSHQNRTPTFKRVSSFLKDHDEDCRNGRKLCRRCQMSMQSGDETKKSESVTSKRSEPLSPRQLWKNKYRPTPAENLIKKVLNKDASRRKFEAVPPDEKPSNRNIVVTMSPKELNKSATNTRNKLKQVKNIMQSHQTFLGKDLDEIIDTLEFRIVDALSNPKNQRSDAFNEIEQEIKDILQAISELKLSNKEYILKTGARLKSKTSVSLDGANEKTENNGKQCNTDTNLLDKKIRFAINEDSATEIWQNPMVNVEEPTQKRGDNLQIIEEIKDNELDDTYSNLGKDIQKVIEGLDAIITLDEQNPEVKKETKQQEAGVQVEMIENTASMKDEQCEQAISSFCQQVDEVIKTFGDMDQLRISAEIVETEIEEKRSDEYLTPFMKAVKDYRQNDAAQSFIDFLDKLAMISKDTVSVHIYPSLPVYTATIQHNAKIVEMSKTYNQAIQYEELTIDKGVGTTQSQIQLLTPLAETCATNSDEILTTNQWIQTDECDTTFYISLSRDELMQSVSSPDVEEYMRNVESEDRYKSFYDKRTQTPSDTNHCCFVESCVEGCQVSSDLLLRTSIAVGDPDCRAMVEVCTAECQALASEGWLTNQEPDSPLEPRITIDRINSVDTVEMEKYANTRFESNLGIDLSDVSIDEYPRNIYTESHISRDRYEQVADSLLCDKRNSYPVTKIPQNKSDLISLFESRKSCSRDFLDNGFNKCSLDSYDSMLARYASSVNPVSSNTSAIAAIHEEPTIAPTKSPQNNETETQKAEGDTFIGMKSAVEDVEIDKRHKHLLHSVYGIVFTLMFLGFNLNYSCCN